MENKDIVKKYLAHNQAVRVIVIDATNMVQSAKKLHSMSNVTTAALGRTLIAATMMGSMLKNMDDRITVQIKGDGPIGSIVVCSNSKLKTKGYATHSDFELPLNSIGKLDVSKAVGKGFLNVIKDIGLKDPFIGYSELTTSEIAEDFAYYFVTSEQTPSVVSLGVSIDKNSNVHKAAGYIIQPLPDTDENIIGLLENINQNINSVTNLMLDLDDIDDVARTITGDNSIECIFEEVPVYECDCSSKRIDRTIIALGKQEAINSLRENHGTLEVCCNFCNKRYLYNEEMINKLF